MGLYRFLVLTSSQSCRKDMKIDESRLQFKIGYGIAYHNAWCLRMLYAHNQCLCGAFWDFPRV